MSQPPPAGSEAAPRRRYRPRRLTRSQLLIGAAVIVVLVAAGALLSRQIPESVSAPLFVLVVIIEVVIAPIPGGAIGYMGAARFGFWQAWPLLYVGNIIGTAIIFLLARKLGTPIFEAHVSARTRARYNALLERHPVWLWFIYAVPIIPLDILSALAGLSSIPRRRFFLIAFTGFVVYTGLVAFIGDFLADLVGVTEALSLLGLVFVLGLGAWLLRRQKAEPKAVFRVGITGNIASGKSAVTEMWQQWGAVVIDADELARAAVAPGSPGLDEVVRMFGREVLGPDDELDRAALRRIVFSDEQKRAELESILHPRIAELRTEAEGAAVERGAGIVVHSIPLLFETFLDPEFDMIVLVDAPTEVRRHRLIETRGLDPAEADAMIAAQMDPSVKRDRAHAVIENDGTLAELEIRAREVWTRIEAAAS